MSNWIEMELGKAIQFNPPEKIVKDSIAKKIPMEKLTAFEKKIKGYELAKYNAGPKFRNGDTLVAKITPCLENGKTAQVDILEDGEVAFGSSEFIVLRENENSINDYLFYLAKSPAFRKRAIGCMEGTSGRKRVNEGALKLQVLPIPNKLTQQKIANVLSSLDSKIEINNCINAQLEAMAKMLYNYWFIQFDFPNLKGKPYKTSGGKMVYNEELKREIPDIKEWRVGTLLDIADYTNGLPCQKYRPIGEEFLRVIKIREMNEGYSSNTEFVRPNLPEKAIVENGDVLFSWSASLEVKIWAGGKGALNQHIFKVTSDNYPKSFYYHQLLNYLQHFKMMAENRKTTMGHITQEHLKQSRIVIPPKELTIRLEKIIYPLFARKINNELENQKLAELRDWLLPMLMNGQIKVSQAVKEVIKEERKPVRVNQTQWQTLLLARYINALKQQKPKPILQGEVGIAKYSYLADKIFGVGSGFKYKQHNFGPYDSAINDRLSSKKYFQKTGDRFYKVFDLTLSGEELAVISDVDFSKADIAMKELTGIFSKFKKDKAHELELMASTCWQIEKQRSISVKKIWQGFKNWKIAGRKEKHKAEVFTEVEVKNCLKTIVTKGWHKKLIGK